MSVQSTNVMSLIAGDYMEVFVSNSQGTRNWIGTTATVGVQSTWFQGYLISRT